MAEGFDRDALMIALDATEQAGVPPELVEQLRGLVRERDSPIRPTGRYEVELNYSRGRPTELADPVWVSVHFADDGPSLMFRPVQATDYGVARHGKRGEVVGEIGGRLFVFNVMESDIIRSRPR